MEQMKDELDETWKNVSYKKGNESMDIALDFINRENDRAARGGAHPRTFPSSGAGDKVFK